MDSKSLEELAFPKYWDERYKGEPDGDFDWFRSFDQVAPLLDEHIPSKESKIVNLGCGNSLLAPMMHEAGYTSIVNIDFSETVINQMKERFPDQTWVYGDIRKTGFEDGEFDVALDKGTLDAMLSGSLWSPPDHVRENITAYIDEVVRTLKPDGVFLYITYRQPHFMKPMLKREGIWTIELGTLQQEEGAFEYFAYVMRKRGTASSSHAS